MRTSIYLSFLCLLFLNSCENSNLISTEDKITPSPIFPLDEKNIEKHKFFHNGSYPLDCDEKIITLKIKSLNTYKKLDSCYTNLTTNNIKTRSKIKFLGISMNPGKVKNLDFDKSHYPSILANPIIRINRKEYLFNLVEPFVFTKESRLSKKIQAGSTIEWEPPLNKGKVLIWLMPTIGINEIESGDLLSVDKTKMKLILIKDAGKYQFSENDLSAYSAGQTLRINFKRFKQNEAILDGKTIKLNCISETSLRREIVI